MDHEDSDTSLSVNHLVRDIDLRLRVIRQEGMLVSVGVPRTSTGEQTAYPELIDHGRLTDSVRESCIIGGGAFGGSGLAVSQIGSVGVCAGHRRDPPVYTPSLCEVLRTAGA